MKTNDPPSMYIVWGRMLRDNRQAYMPINTDPAVPVYRCNERFGPAANEDTLSVPPDRA